MKKTLLLFTSIFYLNAQSQDPPPFVEVDANEVSYSQLLSTVLENSCCADISNVLGVTGTNYNSTDGIGYFTYSGDDFPFEDGIILTTGNCTLAEGPKSGTLSSGGYQWPGDPYIEGFLPWIDPGTTNNVSYLEFEFIPLFTEISFSYIFASEEYGGAFGCDFSDGIVFLLSDQTNGYVSNLALIPGTTDPVSMITVNNGSCPSLNNPEYFGNYYGASGLPVSSAPINLRGHTVPMTALGTVTPGHVYKLKIAIADVNDTAYDSALFIEGGSLNLAGNAISDLVQEITVSLDENGTASIAPEDIDMGLLAESTVASVELSPSTFSADDIGTNTVTVTVTDNYGNVSTYDLTITVQGVLSISDSELSNLKVYPNPFKAAINIQLPSGYSSNDIHVSVFDVNGRLVVKQETFNQDNVVSLELNSLSNGLYFIEISDKSSGAKFTEKIVKS
ncbi:choice-of-anchor L domain-containing protein [Mangrovimonas aestuarii]|uniref:choice-of-anchor L domain-containing protein n=1 Tax=Mangrovimonas aestuarii TaxID=3018443 RepID=UPI002379B979|nr:choice-of-anchor L domain-containing protein [Mangrovimonas aestuarii]